MQQNLNINKEVIRDLIDAQQKGGDTKLLLASLEKLRQENTRLQQLVFDQQQSAKEDLTIELRVQVAELTQQLSQKETLMGNMRKQFQEMLQIASYLAGEDAILENKIQMIAQRFAHQQPNWSSENSSSRNGSDVLKLQGALQLAQIEIERLRKR